MRITYLTEARLDEPTAPAQHVLGLCRALALDGHRIDLVHPGPPLPLGAAGWLSAETVRPYPRMRGGWRLYERALATWLRRRAARGDLDLVYLRLAPSRHVANALRPLRCLRVLELDGTEPLRSAHFATLLDAVDLVLVQEGQEASLRRAFAESFPAAAPKLAGHAHPATDPDHFRPLDRFACRARLGLPPERRILLHASSFQTHHDLGTATAALRLLADRTAQPMLILAGDGPGRRPVRRAAGDLVRSGRLLLPGFVPYDRLPLYLGAADLCLDLCTAAKLREGNLNGFKLLEYLACARPVVQSVDPGLPLEDWAARVLALVPAEDPAAVAAAVQRVLADPEGWAERAAAGRRWVRRRRTWARAASSTVERIEEARLAVAAAARTAGTLP